MNIDEITNVHGGGIELNDINRTNETPIDSIDIYTFYFNNNMYYIVDEDDIIGAVIGQKISHCSNNYYVIYGVKVLSEYRGKLLGSIMYNRIMHHTKRNLMSVNEQTSDGKKLWQTINRTHNVKVLDLLTCKIVSDNIEDAYNNKENLVLVTTQNITESPLIPTFKKRS